MAHQAHPRTAAPAAPRYETLIGPLQLPFRMREPDLHRLAPLRDRGRWTQTAILALLLERPRSRSSLARHLDLTPQGVSAQVKQAIDAGLLRETDEGPAVTPAGVQQVRDGCDRLAAALDAMRAPLAAVETVSAVAAADIEAGQVVGLWMRHGDLVADPGRIGQSRGQARTDAHAGTEAIVSHLEGVVDLAPGTVTVARVPGPGDGGIGAVDEAGLAHLLPAADRFGAVGTGAAVLARRRGRLDFEFGAAEAARNAAERGLDTLLYVSRDRFTEVMRVLEGDVNVRVVEAPLVGSRAPRWIG